MQVFIIFGLFNVVGEFKCGSWDGMGWSTAYGNGSGTHPNTPTSVNSNTSANKEAAPVAMMHIRSKSEAELSLLKE